METNPSIPDGIGGEKKSKQITSSVSSFVR